MRGFANKANNMSSHSTSSSGLTWPITHVGFDALRTEKVLSCYLNQAMANLCPQMINPAELEKVSLKTPELLDR
jgi:hypothetical protein